MIKKSYIFIFTLLCLNLQAFAQENISTETNTQQEGIATDNEQLTSILNKVDNANVKMLKIYNFNPIKNNNANVRIIEFNDLACNACLKKSSDFFEALENTKELKIIYKHKYSKKEDLVNQIALYGLIAKEHNKFWEFKNSLVKNNPKTKDDAIKLLENVGISKDKIYNALMLNSDDYYKQLDADNNLADYFEMSSTPLIFINGYKVDEDLTFEEAIIYANYLAKEELTKQEKEKNKYKIGKF